MCCFTQNIHTLRYSVGGQMHGRTDARTDGRTENIYSIFRDKLLLLGEHVFRDKLLLLGEHVFGILLGVWHVLDLWSNVGIQYMTSFCQRFQILLYLFKSYQIFPDG